MSRIEERFRELGIELPAPKRPVANYIGLQALGRTLVCVGAGQSAAR